MRELKSLLIVLNRSLVEYRKPSMAPILLLLHYFLEVNVNFCVNKQLFKSP